VEVEERLRRREARRSGPLFRLDAVLVD
jgi:hypothetical protein